MSIATLCGRKATPLPAPCFSAAILGRFEAHTLHRESVMWIVFGIGNEPQTRRRELTAKIEERSSEQFEAGLYAMIRGMSSSWGVIPP